MTFQPQSGAEDDGCLCSELAFSFLCRSDLSPGNSAAQCQGILISVSLIKMTFHRPGLPNPDGPSREAGLLGDSRYDQVDNINHHWACVNPNRKENRKRCERKGK